MKIIRQHFEEYPDRKIRDAMLRNMLEHPRGDPPNAIAAGLADALWRGFDWCRTPEGYDHWNALYNRTVVEEITAAVGATLQENHCGR